MPSTGLSPPGRLHDFLTKPYFKLAAIATVLPPAWPISGPRRTKTTALENRLKAVRGSPDIVGDTASMPRVKNPTTASPPPIRISSYWERPGPASSRAARGVHELSRRSQMPLVAVNRGALPENLVESCSSATAKGSLPKRRHAAKGSDRSRQRRHALLDELAAVSTRWMCVKLLRVLESGEVRRVGENEAFHVDIRVVCATNRRLQDLVELAASSAKTCSFASIPSKSTFPRCANAAKTFPIWRNPCLAGTCAVRTFPRECSPPR